MAIDREIRMTTEETAQWVSNPEARRDMVSAARSLARANMSTCTIFMADGTIAKTVVGQ